MRKHEELMRDLGIIQNALTMFGEMLDRAEENAQNKLQQAA